FDRFHRCARRLSCRAYHSMPRYGVSVTVTSRRMPSTSCAYHSGKLSLSPFVMSTAFGSTELRTSAANLLVKDCPRRDAALQLAASGSNASPRNADLSVAFSANRPAPALASPTDSLARPIPARSPHRENVHI